MRPRTSTRRAAAGVMALSTLVLAGCGSAAPDRTIGSPAASAVGHLPSAGPVLFSDPLDDDRNGWGLLDSVYGHIYYDTGDYVVQFRKAPFLHWLPETLDKRGFRERDVVVTAHVTKVSGAAVYGVFCRESPDTDAQLQWYEFVLRDRYAAIRVADDRGNIDVLAKTNDVPAPDGTSVDVTARCADSGGQARLDLAVDGRPLLHATADHPLPGGLVGIQVYAGPEPKHSGPPTLRWHDFVVRRAAT